MTLKEYNKLYRAKNREKLKEKNRIYYHSNKEKIKLKQKEWVEKNPNYHKDYLKKWNKANKENHRKYMIDYNKKRRENDILFKLCFNLRSRLNRVVKSKKMNKDNQLKQYLGCDLDYLKHYLESKFTIDMSWDNYGQWHIDHIIPLNSAKSIEELYVLCHFTNLQPLWAFDNLSKGDKIL